MFGWLTTPWSPRCRHASPAVLSCRVQRTSPPAFMRKLPSLGSVLYLHDASTPSAHEASPQAVLVAERTLAPLLAVRWLMAISAVTENGPREWLECIDRYGHARARLHLLPDTDYLAWEALAMGEESSPSPDSRIAPHLRPGSAEVMSFRWRDMAGLAVLGRGEAAPLSTLGARVAADIARAESVSL